MKVVNLFGGPGVGKSTVAAGLFHLLRVDGRRAELVTEFAKDLVWDRHDAGFEDQMWITANQWRRLYRLKAHDLEFAVVDCPLMLTTVYAVGMPNSFFELVYDLHSGYDNFNVLLRRTNPYEEVGRNQTQAEAAQIDFKIERMLAEHNIPHVIVNADKRAPSNIREMLYGA